MCHYLKHGFNDKGADEDKLTLFIAMNAIYTKEWDVPEHTEDIEKFKKFIDEAVE